MKRLPSGGFSPWFLAVALAASLVLSVAVAASLGSAAVSDTTTFTGAWEATALPGSPSGAFDINDSGVVSGTIGRYWPYNENRAVRWHTDGTTEYLLTPTQPSQNHSEALAVNDVGQATGWVGIGSYWKEAVIWEPDGSLVRLGWPIGASDSRATDINGSGAVAGYTYGAIIPFVWQPVAGGLIWELDHPPLGWTPMMSTPQDMNDAGLVVGYSSTFTSPAPSVAVVWETGSTWTVTVLPGLQGGDKTNATAVNDLGQIVGTSNTAADPVTRRGVMWEQNAATGFWEVRALDGLTGCFPYGVNDLGQIVGTCSSSGHAFLWEDGGVTDLGALIGDVGSTAYAINEYKEIVGVSRSSTNESHAVIWTLEAPRDQVVELIALVESYDLDTLGASLTAKLENALRLLDEEKPGPACQILDAFVNEVEAQTGKGLPSEQAAELIAAAEGIEDAIGCRL